MVIVSYYKNKIDLRPFSHTLFVYSSVVKVEGVVKDRVYGL